VRITRFAGVSSYLVRGEPKLVLYWHMGLAGDGQGQRGADGEVDEVAWLSPADALPRLVHRSDRRLVSRALRRRSGGAAGGGRARVAAGAGAALAAGLALGVAVASPAKRRSLVAGGATGLVGAASAVLAALAVGRHRRRRP
jgi:hypothetical protein